MSKFCSKYPGCGCVDIGISCYDEPKQASPRGRVNVYRCPKGHETITIDIDEGTTPMILGCMHDSCNEMSKSSFYMHEWYKPATDRRMNQAGKEHYKLGGLFIREMATNEKKEKVIKVSRNAPCTCGSGKKYKRCCGKN